MVKCVRAGFFGCESNMNVYSDTFAHFQVVIGGAADSQEQCSSSRDNGYGKCDVCGGVSKHSYALADKDLVNDIVQSAD